MQNIITIENGVTRHPAYRLREPINLQFGADEHIAIVGPNVGRYPYGTLSAPDDERGEV